MVKIAKLFELEYGSMFIETEPENIKADLNTTNFFPDASINTSKWLGHVVKTQDKSKRVTGES